MMASQFQKPAVSAMANTPRPEADGMDSEVLKQQDQLLRSGSSSSEQPRPPRVSPPTSSKRHNLNLSPNSTTHSKAAQAKYIPHEPVKGAVKAVEPAPQARKQRQEKPNAKRQDSPEVSIQPQMSIAEAVALKSASVGKSSRETVKYINVPFYDAPSHLSAKAYQMIDKYQNGHSQNTTEVTKAVVPKPQTSAVQQESTVEAQNASDSDADSRSVEGQVATPDNVLQKDIENLKEQLQVQTKVNEDLKKLLVASMGDDLHYRVECLVRTNAQLAADLSQYCSKISQDGENMDQLGIQADIWRSKYHASRVQVEELLALKASLSQLYENSCTALEELLRERYQLRDALFSTYRTLQQLCDAFEPLPPTNRPASYAPKSVTDIAERNYTLSDNIKFRLLGAIKLYPALYNIPTPNVMTPAEELALQALAEKPEVSMVENEAGFVSVPLLSVNSQQDAKFTRFHPHPYTKYDNVTFDCCATCTGDIYTV